MSRTIREAKPADMSEIMQVMEAAKKMMRTSASIPTRTTLSYSTFKRSR